MFKNVESVSLFNVFESLVLTKTVNLMKNTVSMWDIIVI